MCVEKSIDRVYYNLGLFTTWLLVFGPIFSNVGLHFYTFLQQNFLVHQPSINISKYFQVIFKPIFHANINLANRKISAAVRT